MNPLLSRGFTWNIKPYFLWKTMKKYLWMSSAAVVTGALRVKFSKEAIPSSSVVWVYGATDKLWGFEVEDNSEIFFFSNEGLHHMFLWGNTVSKMAKSCQTVLYIFFSRSSQWSRSLCTMLNWHDYGLHAYNFFFQICYKSSLNKIIETTAPMNPYKNRTATACLCMEAAG